MTLPNFIVIGAGKGGTTSLYHYLKQHPQIFVSPIKETNYFAWDLERPGARLWATQQHNEFPVKDRAAYEALFAGARESTAIGEVSPIYLESLFAPERIRSALPEVRIVATLRNPIDRAYSGYWMQVQAGLERRPIEEAFGVDEHRVQAGFYARMLERYYALFPPDRVKIMILEQWKKRAVEAMQELYAFLGVATDFVPAVHVIHNVGGVTRSRLLDGGFGSRQLRALARAVLPSRLRDAAAGLRRRRLERPPPLPAALRNRLRELYREDWERLEALTGDSLEIWRAEDDPQSSS